MTMTMTNRGLYHLLNTAISGSTDLRAAVFTGSVPSVASIRDMNFLSDLTAVSTEAAASGYSRADLAGVTLSENDAADKVTLVATAPEWANVAAGETWTHVAYYIEGASDAARVLVAVDDPASDQVTNGGNITGPTPAWDVTGS